MAGIAAMLLIGACGQGPAESQQQALVQVAEPAGALKEVNVRPFPYHGLGSFSVWAHPEGATGERVRVRVRVRTTGGDEEQIDLLPASGPLPRQLVVSMRAGEHLASLRARMSAARLRFGSFGITGENGLLHVVDGDPAAALARVRDWPEVRSAAPNAVINMDGASSATVVGTLPMDEADPVAGNGTLELRPGETAAVEYRSADGALASTDAAFDSRSDPNMRAFVPLLVREVERALYGDSVPRPQLLIDAGSFAMAAWHASGARITPAEAVAGLPSGYRVVSAPTGARCRGSVFPRDCSDVASGTFLYTTGMFRTAVRYEMVASFRAPATAPGCLLQQSFSFSWRAGAWHVDSTGPITPC